MAEGEPLTQRYDLKYVHRATPQQRLVRWLSLGGVALIVAYFVFAGLLDDSRAYSSGPLTQAHAMFGIDCAQCHEADPDTTGYWLPVQDEACLRCHVAGAHHGLDAAHPDSSMRVSDRFGRMSMALNCASCHVEHQGPDHNLLHVPDAACVECHGQLNEIRSQIEALDARQPGHATPGATRDATPTAPATPTTAGEESP